MAESPALAQACGIEVERVIRATWIIAGGARGAGRRLRRPDAAAATRRWASTCCSRCSPRRSWAASAACPARSSAGCWSAWPRTCRCWWSAPATSRRCRFLLLLLVLLLRPQGLFGETTRGRLIGILSYLVFFACIVLILGIVALGPQPAVGLHRPVQRRRGRLLRDRRLHARHPHRRAAARSHRQLRAALDRRHRSARWLVTALAAWVDRLRSRSGCAATTWPSPRSASP